MAIPKIIHYCWVGGNPKPQSVLYCIESWRRFCPDYEIREWNETNYDFTKNAYMRQAYEAKKWGFVPDYARLDIVYTYGGVYFDTDVELVRSLDGLLENQCFFGFENTGDGEWFVNCGHGFGAVAGHEAIKAARDHYEHLSFFREDGSLNQLASPYYTTQSLRQLGLRQEDRDQKLGDIQVYASDVMCPKNFRTGRLQKTGRTVSVHHFSASWVDEAIKMEMERQQKIKNRFGDRFGGFVLYAESVLQKYKPAQIPERVFKRTKERIIQVKDALPAYMALAKAAGAKPGEGDLLLLDTSMDSDNCGDAIIMENCVKQLPAAIAAETLRHIPTHRLPDESERVTLRTAKKKILCGTNILSGKMRTYGLWRMAEDVGLYRNTVLMGVGFDSASADSDWYTRWLFSIILDRNALHSVRDSFSEQKLKSMGITNVVNTGCPTMWGLTPEHCAAIPAEKAKRVICTVTDYCRDPANDRAMLDVLLESYETVFLWLQGQEDLAYIRELGYEDRLCLIPPGLEAFDMALEEPDLDYVGTRLHAGIRALSKGHRSLVISVDNRARCIARDTGLPILLREDVSVALRTRIYGDIQTEIQLPLENIVNWKTQFDSAGRT